MDFFVLDTVWLLGTDQNDIKADSFVKLTH